MGLLQSAMFPAYDYFGEAVSEPPPVIPFGLLALHHPPMIMDSPTSNVAG